MEQLSTPQQEVLRLLATGSNNLDNLVLKLNPTILRDSPMFRKERSRLLQMLTDMKRSGFVTRTGKGKTVQIILTPLGQKFLETSESKQEEDTSTTVLEPSQAPKVKSSRKLIGGILSIIGASLILAADVLMFLMIFSSSYRASWIISLVIAILALFGGILGCKYKKSSGIIGLIAGILALGVGVLGYFSGQFFVNSLSSIMISFFIPSFNFFGITIEEILIMIGGILMLASSSASSSATERARKPVNEVKSS